MNLSEYDSFHLQNAPFCSYWILGVYACQNLDSGGSVGYDSVIWEIVTNISEEFATSIFYYKDGWYPYTPD